MGPLDLHVEYEARRDLHSLGLQDVGGELLFLLGFDGVEPFRQSVVDVVLEITDAVQIAQEALSDLLADQPGELVVAQTQPAARRHAVGNVGELLRRALVPAAEQVGLQDLTVDLGHAVDLAGHVDGQIRHLRHVVADDVQIAVGILGAQLLLDAQQNVADVGDHAAQKLHVPALQRFAHDGVVGVAEHAADDIEGLVEAHALGHQQPDQFRDRHGGMGVVELDSEDALHLAEIVDPVALVGVHDILQRGAGEEVLLLYAQALSLPGGVVGIKHAGDVLGPVFLRQGTGIVLLVERVEIKLLFGLALPESQRADIFREIADDGRVVGHGQHGLIGEPDPDRVLLAAVAPGIAVFCPVVGRLALGAVLEGLLEQAEAVAQTVAAQGDAAGDGAVQIAGRQTAQTAVAQGGVLDLLEAGQIHALPGERVFHLVEYSEIEQVVVDQPADQVLGGKIEGFAFARAMGTGFGPVVADGQHHRAGQRVVQMLGGRLVQPLVLVVFEQGLSGVEYILR